MVDPYEVTRWLAAERFRKLTADGFPPEGDPSWDELTQLIKVINMISPRHFTPEGEWSDEMRRLLGLPPLNSDPLPPSETRPRVVDVIESLWSRVRLTIRRPGNRGRPRGSTAIPPEEFPAKYREAYEAVAARIDERPSMVDVAAQLDISKTTLDEYRKRDQLSWPPA